MKVAVVLVHYHTPELLPEAVEALRADAAGSALELELVVVDNGSRPEDRGLLGELPARLIVPGRNLGYAGAFNRGVAETEAPYLVVMNPDVFVLPGCLAALAATLAGGAGAAGPRLFWDRGRRFLLPPTESATRRRELLGAFSSRSPGWALRARSAWRRHAWRHWLADEPLSTFDLSGAMLALDRRTLQQVGPFDEAYELYFEETDWLARLRRAGGHAVLVPAAEAVHLYAQSSLGEEASAEWFERSQQRFRSRAYGAWFRRSLELLGRRPADPREPEPDDRLDDILLDPRAAWLEVSASPHGFPAGGCRLAAAPADRVPLPAELNERRLPTGLTARTVSARGEELGLATLRLG